MSFVSLKYLIFLFGVAFGYNEFSKGAKESCSIDQLQPRKLVCLNFDLLSELDFGDFVTVQIIEEIELRPNKQTKLDADFSLNGLNLFNKYETIFERLDSIEIVANPFVSFYPNSQLSKLTLKDSLIEFFFEDKHVDDKYCDHVNQNFIFVTVLNLAQNFKLHNVVAPQFCPILFKYADLETFEISNLKEPFSFYELKNLTNENALLNCKIRDFIIANSLVVNLNSRILNEEIFKNVKLISIQNSSLGNVQRDVFQKFYHLKSLEFEVNNFRQLVDSINEWSPYLNVNVSVDLNDPNLINQQNYLKLTMQDNTNTYEYSESEFCFFKKFPHQKLILPVIRTKPNLECTCTLMWLLSYKKIYDQNDVQIMDTSSTSACLNSPNFNQIIANCNFAQKLIDCDAEPTRTSASISTTRITSSSLSSEATTTGRNLTLATTGTTISNTITNMGSTRTSQSAITANSTVDQLIRTSTKKSSPNSVEITAIVLSIVLAGFIIAGVIYYFKFYRNKHSKIPEEISFKPLTVE